jgi:hypothetical protein
MILQALQIIAAIGTMLTGFIALFRPQLVEGFTGLRAQDGRSTTEIRSVLGVFFVALSAPPLILNAMAAYQMLGIAYLVVGVTRAISMFVTKSVVQSNIVSLVVEIVFGVVLVL